MTLAQYLVNRLVEHGVTDVFGIPGGVVLDFLYAAHQTPGITPHLSYHEQAAGFEACGYAQYRHQLGVCYATRGPGFTNLITAMADAYADSLPVLFLTAHAGKTVGHAQRFEKDQELNTVAMVREITKYAAVIEETEELRKIDFAIRQALSHRKGPVFLDVSAGLWCQEVSADPVFIDKQVEETIRAEDAARAVLEVLEESKRPVLLVGDGVRQGGVEKTVEALSERLGIPVLSSRGACDIGAGCMHYGGYIGSHGMRHSNFIFAKADTVIVLGNRLAFPANSKTFRAALENKRMLWIDVDSRELARTIPNTIHYEVELKDFLTYLTCAPTKVYTDWIAVCQNLRQELQETDRCETVDSLISVLSQIPGEISITCDVGNNEFWFSQAYVLAQARHRILFSKSFGTLGNALGKAIGAHFASKKPAVCIVGDQGFQLNIQELQLISQEKLPITIYVINNRASAMIRDREITRHSNEPLHTTQASGFGSPNLKLIAQAYGIQYQQWPQVTDNSWNTPSLVEIEIWKDSTLRPSLTMDCLCQDMSPPLPRELFTRLNAL